MSHDYTKRTAYHEKVAELRKAHKVLKEWSFTPSLPERGYTNRTLFVNLTTLEIKEKPVTEQMKDLFVGGRGFGLWYLWQAIKPTTKWNDPENEIIISPGPLGGNTQYPGSGKSLVVSLSPTTGIPIDSNVGGYFGPLMKFSGFDALEITGKARNDVIIVIDGQIGKVYIEEAPQEDVNSHAAAEQFTHMYAKDHDDLRNVSVVASGRGAEHALIGCLNFSWFDVRRQATRLKQAGRGGIGTVFRDKKLKALVVHAPPVKGDMNRPADFDKVAKVGIKMHKELADFDLKQCNMRRQGTAHLVEIMDNYDLLPVHNFQYGNHPDTKKIASWIWDKRFTQGIPDGCWYGCSMQCSKGADGHVVKTGPYKGHIVTVDGPEYETAAGCAANCGIFDPDWLLEANFYCDTYGIDTISFGTACAFVMECYQRGILNKERTGGLELTWGNAEAQLELLHQMARGEGFGVIVGQGVARMKQIFIEKKYGDPQLIKDIGMEVKGLEYSQYQSKESLAQQGGYALTNKGPQHDEAWLIFMDMVNNQIPSFEDKAEALYYFPLFRTWFGLNGFCKLPWNDIEPPDNHKYPPLEAAKVPEHVQNYCDVFTGITGRPLTKEGLIAMSETVYQFQRVFNIRMGKGRREHDLPPYRSVGPVTREEYESRQERYDKQLKEWMGIDPATKTIDEKIALHRKYREDRYQKLMDAVYKRRGWTADGVPTLETLKRCRIDLPEVVEVVKPYLK
ncbi:MAG: Tungsten-containing aldehyde:ferredoxin oxidoreductase [Candidatus Ozemobacter sibiricus]|jgi:aldehyde:ferredoxin oxidoreductase|uniref:Tungsten-containing aldehyde:ferredoxin oxidoreductase n=1 Tax=Candidatus Ozemobacter sibiricus TaxID=2268124 RepID=A0A367ZRG1_9BACT|nr:MAG: Tungsten-containing aldehyde:ferredoxin oxidoreductase [Candidatus Ozemobacter sibiricus]